MATQRFLKLGERAQSYYDAGTRLQLSRGQVMPVSLSVYNSSKTQRAIRGGHLEKANEDEFEDYYERIKGTKEGERLEKMAKKYEQKEAKSEKKPAFEYDENTEPEELAKNFNLEQLKKEAKDYEIEVPANATKLEIASAIIEYLQEEEEEGE